MQHSLSLHELTSKFWNFEIWTISQYKVRQDYKV